MNSPAFRIHALLPLLLAVAALCARAAEFRVATFSVDVTIPLGHPCMGGGISPAKSVADPLFAKGFVLTGAEKPFIVIAFDWCEIRGTSFEKWKRALAEAAGTEPQRVLVTSTHVHDAPVMDEDAEKLLRDMEATGAWKNIPPPDPNAAIQIASVCQPEFNEACIPRVAAAVRESLQHARRVTHFGAGRAKVERIAGNRRFITSAGTVSYARMSRSTSREVQDADEGTIDPWLRTLSFWDGDTAVCALHSYAVHPMSSYGAGKVSADFPGEARALMQQAHPDVLQIYTTGCAGNVTAGKYNTGAPENRSALAGRLRDAMETALKNTQRTPLTQIGFRLALMPLGARATPNHTEEILRSRLASGVRPFERSEAAMGLAWYERVRRGHRVEIPAIEFDPAHVLILLPAEAYVEFQLFAQECRPDAFVLTMGYGECGPGYIPIERAFTDKDSNLNDWAWTPPGSEAVMKDAIREVLTR
ncbi:MAG: hypothetical protein ABIP20_10820 [Chthoniobacteraceae bacterium]